MKKRLLSILLTLCMIVCILPTEVFAVGGAAYNPEEVTTGSDTYKNYSGYEYKVTWIENDYIRVYCVEPKFSSSTCYMVTVPARTKASAKEAYDMVINKKTFQMISFSKKQRKIDWNSKKISLERYPTDKDPWTIKAEFKLGGNKYYSTAHYQIMELDSGVESGFSAGGKIHQGDTKSQKTYGIKTDIESGYVGNPPDSMKPENEELSYQVYMKNFGKMGHPSASNTAPLYMSTAVGNLSDGFTNVAQAVPLGAVAVKTNKTLYSKQSEAVTEVLTRGYSWANPFTLTSNLYCEYVDGFTDSMPDYFWASASGDVTTESRLELMGKERPNSNVSTLWGFRNLVSAEDESFTPSDDVTIATSAKHLGIHLKNKQYQVIPAANESELTKNEKTYGKLVAKIRGNYEEKNNRYVFTSGAAALSPTITATWSANGGFSVGKNGSISLSHVSLNTPSFKFYQENGNVQNGLSMAVGEDGLIVTMKPDSNSAVMSTDIAGTKVSPETATILTSGNIRFQGKADFSLFRGSEFKMEELGYGMKDSKFKFNGIRATGSISTASMMGLDMAKIEGTIDTFKPYYHFNMELNVFDLFESKAELELMQSNLTGTLMPNKIYFYAGSDYVKIPLISPVVVAHISGAGGGIDHLVETFNGDFFAIPPINLSITGTGDILNTIKGTATYTFGPAYFKLVAEDIEVLGITNLVDKFSISEGTSGASRDYKGTTYTGMKGSCSAAIEINIPQKEKVIQARGDFEASAFGGFDSYTNPTKLHVNADLSGGIEGSLHFPKSWKVIGGKKLASTSFDFYLGANTVVPVRDTSFEGSARDALENLEAYGGVKKESDWKLFKYRVYYIFPENDAGFTIKGFWSKLPEWNWENHRPSAYNSYNDEDGALAVMCVNMNTVDAAVTSNNTENGTDTLGNYSYDVSIDTSTGETIPGDATTILMVTPQNGTDINAFAQSLTISNNGQPVSLTLPQYNENDEIINESDINSYITQNGEGNDCVLVGLGEGASASDTWTVTSSMADFEASMNASAAFDSLKATLTGNTLTASISNPDTTPSTQSLGRSANDAVTDYVLATYFGSASGETAQLIDMQDVSDPSNISVTIPDKGTIVSTGSYYVTAKILKRSEVEVENEDGTKETKEVLLPVDTKEVGTVNYTNTVQPDAPASAAIQPVGNEVMNASWSEVTDADGYKVTIYQQQDDGSFVDTGKGYSYDAADIKDSKVNGISYDKNSGTFKLDMAMTVGGEDIDADGNKTQSQNGTLEADKTYQVGVQAYKYMTDETGTKIDNSQVYSVETRSNESVLPKYEPHNISFTFQTLRGSGYSSSFVDHTVTEENGVFHCTAGAGSDNSWYITFPNDGVKYTMTRMDDTTKKYNKQEYWDYHLINNSDITGSVTYQIDAQVDHGTYTDTTTKYLVVDMDTTAPMLSLNDDVVYANRETGEYTVNGITEPNTQVYLNVQDYYDGNLEEAAMSDENGNFSYKGKLQLTYEQEKTDDEGNTILDEEGNPVMETIRDESGEVVGLIAADENGNRSDIATAIVTLPPTYSVTFDANGGTGTMDSVTGLTGTYTLPACGFTAPEGLEFAGWSTDPEGETMLSENIELESDMTLYAIWQEKHKHSYGDWKSDDTNHWRECSCGDKSETAAHTPSAWIVDTPATTDNVGKRHQECTVCKRVLKTETIAVLNSDIIVNGAENGTVTVSPTSAAKGSTVTITTTPNNGYQLNKLTVTDANGNAVSFNDIGSGKYTFTMPNSKVTVNASFSKVKPKITFVDVPSDAYYANAVAWAVENEITNGTSETTFSPDASCTRAQMVTFLWRANGSPKVSGSNPFVDVPANEYYYDAVQWAVQKGITKGTSATTFDPNATVTRGQTVTFLWRANGSPEASGSTFSDVSANEYYAKAVTWAVSKGITNGTGDGKFSPNDNCTRAQIVTLMYRQATK